MDVSLIDAEQFRQTIAGLIVEDQPSDDRAAQFRAIGVKVVLMAAKHYNRDVLDPLKLWDRIGTALKTAVAKAPDGDPERLCSAILDHVKADVSAVTRDDLYAIAAAAITDLSASDRKALVAYLLAAHYAVLVHGREAWEQYKVGTKAGAK